MESPDRESWVPGSPRRSPVRAAQGCNQPNRAAIKQTQFSPIQINHLRKSHPAPSPSEGLPSPTHLGCPNLRPENTHMLILGRIS